MTTTTGDTTTNGSGGTQGGDQGLTAFVELARALHANLQRVLLGTPDAVTVAVVAALGRMAAAIR